MDSFCSTSVLGALVGQLLVNVDPGPMDLPRKGLCSGVFAALWAPLASLGLGLEIPVTSLACHRRNRDPGDSRSPVCSAGLS